MSHRPASTRLASAVRSRRHRANGCAPTAHQTYFAPHRFAVLSRDGPTLFKFIATPQYGTEELYDLRADRGEVRNLVSEQPAPAAALRDKVRADREDRP